jgi:hypothetical protein
MSDDRNHRLGHRHRGRCGVDERRLDVLVIVFRVIVFRGPLSFR